MGDEFPGAMAESTIRDLAGLRGVDLTDEQVRAVRTFQSAMAPDLARMRAVELDFRADGRTPADARAWLEGFDASTSADDRRKENPNDD